jgi:hypothetical protein
MRPRGSCSFDTPRRRSGCIIKSAMRSKRDRGSKKKGGIVTRVRSWPGINDLTMCMITLGAGGSVSFLIPPRVLSESGTHSEKDILLCVAVFVGSSKKPGYDTKLTRVFKNFVTNNLNDDNNKDENEIEDSKNKD